MKQNAEVNGYLITSKPTNAGAGKCVWAFAEKDGEEYFIKEFLDPKRPRPDSMGSPEQKEQLFAQCAEFERRHRAVVDRIDPKAEYAGNLVVARDFFCERSRYYKVTERLLPVELNAPQDLPSGHKRVLLATLCASLRLLHGFGIVHGDLKPDNILLTQPSDKGLYVSKLIDFDDAYVSGDPPDRDTLGGDPVHGAPEWVRYLNGASVRPRELTTAVDVFALALVVHRFLTGELPGVHGHDSAASAVNAGDPPVLDPRLNPAVASLLKQGLSADPRDRPKVAGFAEVLDDDLLLELREPPPVFRRPSRVRVNLGSAKPPAPTGVDGSRVRINLRGRTESDR